MLKLLRKRRAQSTVEYAILVIIIMGALIAIQVYIKRGVQGRLRSAADDIGEQFEPGATNYHRHVISNSYTRDTVIDGESETNMLSPEITNVTMNQELMNTEQTYWGAP